MCGIVVVESNIVIGVTLNGLPYDESLFFFIVDVVGPIYLATGAKSLRIKIPEVTCEKSTFSISFARYYIPDNRFK